MNDKLLVSAGGYQIGTFRADGEAEIGRIEFRNDGCGVSGFYDVIYIYLVGRDEPWRAFPAHNCDYWEYAE